MKNYLKRTIDSLLAMKKSRGKSGFKARYKGFTILELLMATGISAVVITTALSSVGSIYFTQKRVQFAHDFYAENRLLLERVVQTIRNNTLDYDRAFIVYGPPADVCPQFNLDQVGTNLTTNDIPNRALLTYPSIFYWDTNGDLSNQPDRNLGGADLAGANDPCAQAWNSANSLETLYLINSAQNLRTSITRDGSTQKVMVERQLAADIDGDNIADIWGPADADEDDDIAAEETGGDIELVWDGSLCELHYDENGDTTIDSTEEYPILGDSNDEDLCDRAHVATVISPDPVLVNQLIFTPSPNRDPFLNFRVNEAQVHPHVSIFLDTELRDPDSYGFDATDKPDLQFQTSASSRVFGDIRR